jgi:histidinol-phosphate phosphatase family domain/HAD-superfamily hydrolase, subfamily IIIA
MKKCVFLDRDGVIIEDIGYISNIKEVRLIKNVGEYIRLLNSKGFYVIVITNQSGVARGYFDLNTVNYINQYIQKCLLKYDAYIQDFYVCPHYVNGIIKKFSFDCGCRKPKPGMLFAAKRDYNLDFEHTYLIGDKRTDYLAGNNAGLRKSYLIPINGEISEAVYDILDLEGIKLH